MLSVLVCLSVFLSVKSDFLSVLSVLLQRRAGYVSFFSNGLGFCAVLCLWSLVRL